MLSGGTKGTLQGPQLLETSTMGGNREKQMQREAFRQSRLNGGKYVNQGATRSLGGGGRISVTLAEQGRINRQKNNIHRFEQRDER